ncbi:MAG: ABC transporter permease [Ruminococcaceae bacterium]|nr:ABC transporter permease [Oscillospiraceae bacterium]
MIKQFFTVFKFELLGQLKNKRTIILTTIVVVAIALLLSFPRFSGLIDKIKKEDGTDKKEIQVIEVMYDEEDAQNIVALLQGFLGEEYEVKISSSSKKALKEKVKGGKIHSALLITSPTTYEYIVDTVDMYSVEEKMINAALENNYRFSYLKSQGLSDEQVGKALLTEIIGETIVTGKDQASSFGYTYAVVLILYMVLLLYGQFVASNVASEKGTRAMETLITSAKPVNLMFGKILGTGSAGLIQLILILGSAIGFYQLNKEYATNEMIKSLFDMPISVAVYSVVFFILGYFIYAFMFGAAGSLTSRVEDLGSLIMPINFTFIACFMISIVAMTTSNGVNETYFIVCSFIPFFASMAMLVRVSMGIVAVWEIALSIGIQIVTIVVLGILCTKIYRAGVLLYGNTPKLKDIIRILRTSEAMK